MHSTPTTRHFSFAQASVFVVPAEALTRDGADPAWAAAALEQQRLTPTQLRCLESSFALYWQWALALFAKAPGSWFPPRQTHVLVVSEPAAVAPYLDPFGGTSSLLYLSDLDTNPSYVACLFLHNERVAMVRSLRAAILCNLSHWLVLDAASLQAFCQGARQATRPDAPVFVLLADALPWIAEIHHLPLRPPAPEADEPCQPVPEAGLLVPMRLRGALMSLCNAAEAMLQEVLQRARPARRAASAESLDALCDWMQAARAHLIVKAADGRTVWTPQTRDATGLRRALSPASNEAVASLLQDFRTVHARSRSFLDALVEPSSLPRHCAVLEAGDGAYLDAQQHAVVYELRQPGFDASADPAPPFHRLLLGARVVHEWGHLAHTARMLRVPEPHQSAYAQARAELGEIFLGITSRMPRRLQAEVDEAVRSLPTIAGTRADALARKALARVGDYLANLLCSRLLPPDELQAYVRANVRSHVTENLDLVSELARYAHEVHYLDLAAIPHTCFFSITRYTHCFIDTGLVSEDHTHALFDATGRVLASYAVDETRLRLPPRAQAEGPD